MISFIVPTIGRASLARAIESIELWPGDEILIAGWVDGYKDWGKGRRVRSFACQRGHDWGCAERTLAMRHAQEPYLAFLDDDDIYTPGHRELMEQAIKRNPDGPTIFRMIYPNGFVLWREPLLRCGNVGTPQFLIPNDRARMGRWTKRREGDFDFITSSAWPVGAIQWSTDIICALGHNDDVEPREEGE